jgi:hypothetical protein
MKLPGHYEGLCEKCRMRKAAVISDGFFQCARCASAGPVEKKEINPARTPLFGPGQAGKLKTAKGE